MSRNSHLIFCLNYRLKGLAKASLIYLAIFMLVDLVVPILLFLAFRRGAFGDNTFSYGISGIDRIVESMVSYPFLISTMIFLFVGAVASFSENFNFLLTLNCTRRNQYISDMILMLVTGASAMVCSVVIHGFEFLVEALVNRVSLSQMWDHYSYYYIHHGEPNAAGLVTAQLLNDLLLAMSVFLCAYALGYAAGVLSYRFGRGFTIPFWICFGASFVFIPILVTSVKWIGLLARWYVGAGQPPQSPAFAVHILLTALVLAAIGGLSIRKLQQNN
jgi:hypothetical protein